MATKRDYYTVLEVDRGVNDDLLKKAYRKAAIKYHPDKNPGNKAAEEKFKEAAEAYDVLSNPNKRARYDQFGHEGMSGAAGNYGGRAAAGGAGGFTMEDIFSNFGDIFGGHFGGAFSGFGGGGGSAGVRVNRGSDLRIKVKLTLKEILNGVTKKLKINKQVACSACKGSGAKDGNSYSICSTCGGQGVVTRVVNTFFGQAQSTATCNACGGEGKIITNPCSTCKGDGIVKGEEVVAAAIPAGVAEGMQLSVSGKGNAARRGGVNGDLLIIIEEEHHQELERYGNDLLYNLNITIPTAIIGDTVTIPTIEGGAKTKIQPGTQAGQVLRLKGQGLPDINSGRRGDILAVVDITIPLKISSEEKKIIEQLKTKPAFAKPEKRSQNIFERMRNFFS